MAATAITMLPKAAKMSNLPGDWRQLKRVIYFQNSVLIRSELDLCAVPVYNVLKIYLHKVQCLFLSKTPVKIILYF